MTYTYAIAVDRYLDALARFDGPVPPLGPRAVDWCAMREATVLAEEAELERLTGHTTRSAGGGGETLSPAGRQQERKERRRLGDAQSEGWKRRKAAARQREEGAMQGKKTVTDEQMAAFVRAQVKPTTELIAQGLRLGYDTTRARLNQLHRKGLINGHRGPGKGAPMIWSNAANDRRIEAERKIQQTRTARVVPEPKPQPASPSGIDSVECWRISVAGLSLVVTTDAALDRLVAGLVANALREAADRAAEGVIKGAA